MNYIFDALDGVFSYFGVYDDALRVAAGFFCVLFVVILLLRILGSSVVRTGLTALTFSGKKITAKSDVDKITNPFLRGVLKDYIEVGERGAGHLDARAVVVRRVDNMKLFGWRLTGVEAFAAAAENAALPLGVIGVIVFRDYALFCAALAAAGFALGLVGRAAFGIGSSRVALTENLIYYVEKEAGKFFTADAGNAVLRLKNDLTNALDRNAKAAEASIDRLSSVIKDSLASGMADIVKQTGEAAKTVTAAAALVKEFGAATNAAGESFKGYYERNALYMATIKEQTANLVGAVGDLREQTAGNESIIAANSKTLELLTANQNALDAALQGFDAAMKSLPSELGGILGRVIDSEVARSNGGRGGGADMEAFSERVEHAVNALADKVKAGTDMTKSLIERLDMETGTEVVSESRDKQ